MQKILRNIFILLIAFPFFASAASPAPIAETKLVKEITHNSAQIYASVSSGEGEDNAYWFEWGVVGEYEDQVIKTTRRTFGLHSVNQQVSYSLRGLSPETQYYFRIIAENQKGLTAGQVLYFTTRQLDNPIDPIVIATTERASSIKNDSALLHSVIATHGGQAQTWFEYGETNKLEYKSYDRQIGSSGADVEMKIQNLTSGTTYYFQAVASNDRGVVRGVVNKFTTTGTKPVLEARKDQKVSPIDTSPQAKKTNPSTSLSASSGGIFSGIFNSGSSTKTTTSEKDSVSGINVIVSPKGNTGLYQTIEYQIAYSYSRNDSANDAELQISVPKSLTYVSDSTSNELMVSSNADGSKVYYLTIGALKKGDKRTISIITTVNTAVTKIPTVDAKLVFTNNNKQRLAVSSLIASVGGSSSASNSSFPTTLIGLFIVLNLIVGSIVMLLRAKSWFQAARENASNQENSSAEAVSEIEKMLREQPLVVPASLDKQDDAFQAETVPSGYASINNVGLPGMQPIQ